MQQETEKGLFCFFFFGNVFPVTKRVMIMKTIMMMAMMMVLIFLGVRLNVNGFDLQLVKVNFTFYFEIRMIISSCNSYTPLPKKFIYFGETKRVI